MTREKGRKTYCEAINAEFVYGSERCAAQPYADVVYDGETWTVCREHFLIWLDASDGAA